MFVHQLRYLKQLHAVTKKFQKFFQGRFSTIHYRVVMVNKKSSILFSKCKSTWFLETKLPIINQNVTFSIVDHISTVVDLFGRSLRVCYLEFDKEAISDG